jgi:hypothetical protein
MGYGLPLARKTKRATTAATNQRTAHANRQKPQRHQAGIAAQLRVFDGLARDDDTGVETDGEKTAHLRFSTDRAGELRL